MIKYSKVLIIKNTQHLNIGFRFFTSHKCIKKAKNVKLKIVCPSNLVTEGETEAYTLKSMILHKDKNLVNISTFINVKHGFVFTHLKIKYQVSKNLLNNFLVIQN